MSHSTAASLGAVGAPVTAFQCVSPGLEQWRGSTVPHPILLELAEVIPLAWPAATGSP